MVRQIVRGVLANHEFTTIVEATSYEGAVKQLNEGPFDIVFTDINYDGNLEGYKLIERIRDQKSGSDVPIIVLTGEADKNHIIKSIHLGANDYILKPFVEADVDEKVKSYFETIAKPNSAYQKNSIVEKDIASGEFKDAEKRLEGLLKIFQKVQKYHIQKAYFYIINKGETQKAISKL